MGMVTVKRFDFWLVNLNPTLGSEISKNRPCLVVSPDEINNFLNTVIVVPLTSTIKNYPTRFNLSFGGRTGQLAVDQIRSIDKFRLIKKIGILDKASSEQLCKILTEAFSY